jgi:O-antigen ligase
VASGARDSTSVGQRIEFYRTTLEIIEDHPLVGVGTGGFTRAFAEKIRGTPAMMTDNPHNDYLLLAAQAGIPAMVLLIGFLCGDLALRVAPRIAAATRLLRGVVIALGVGGLFNSLLFDPHRRFTSRVVRRAALRAGHAGTTTAVSGTRA